MLQYDIQEKMWILKKNGDIVCVDYRLEYDQRVSILDNLGCLIDYLKHKAENCQDEVHYKKFTIDLEDFINNFTPHWAHNSEIFTYGNNDKDVDYERENDQDLSDEEDEEEKNEEIVCLDEIQQPYEVANLWDNNVIVVLDPEQQARKSHNASQRKYIDKIKTDNDKLKKLKEQKHDLYIKRKDRIRAEKIANGQIINPRGRPRKNIE